MPEPSWPRLQKSIRQNRQQACYRAQNNPQQFPAQHAISSRHSLTLLETIPEAAVHVLKVSHAASAGGLPPDGLHTPVVCKIFSRGQKSEGAPNNSKLL